MIYYSKAPLRIGLAGGGTDVSPYSEQYGGAVLNASISLYAHASIEPLEEQIIILQSPDKEEGQQFDMSDQLPFDGKLDLLKAVYNRIKKDHGLPSTGFRLTVFSDVPMGSGLGSSSTLVVAIVGAFMEMLKLPWSSYDIARYAYDIERNDLQLAGGKQDQYAAAFGGINFMQFVDGKVIVQPLQIQQEYLQELQNDLVLYYTDTSRESAAIIKEQVSNVYNNNERSVTAMHRLKEQSLLMKEALLNGRMQDIGELLELGFEQKRLMASNISNDTIEAIHQAAKNAGAAGGKISGAGGGGFMIFYCPGNTRNAVITALKNCGGEVRDYSFTDHGLTTWTV
jgi:D-glycero-alpha-D-manno-heptose-7-phosphate kinase